MKKTITGMLALLAGAYAVHAQGTVNFFNYAGDNGGYVYVAFKPLAGGTTTELGGSASGPAPTLQNYAAELGNGNDWTVALYAAPGANVPFTSLVPVAGITATLANGSTDPTAGTWYSSLIATIPGTTGAGSVATLELVAWYNEGGLITSYAQALADFVPAGFGGTANVTLGGPASSGPPANPAGLPVAALGNFTVSPTPEPSTIALGVIGASAFLMRLRRKQ